MNVYQMLRHLNVWNEWVLGRNELSHKQSLVGKLFGKRALKKELKSDRLMAKNMPAGKGFTTKEVGGDFEIEKKSLVQLVEEFQRYDEPYFFHDFYGKMSLEQIGWFAYKHLDHHLRQFNV